MYAGSAVDGNAATAWVPDAAEGTLTADLGHAVRLAKVSPEWTRTRPATYAYRALGGRQEARGHRGVAGDPGQVRPWRPGGRGPCAESPCTEKGIRAQRIKALCTGCQ